MAGVLDCETDIVLVCKGNSFGDIIRFFDFDGIPGVIPERAGLILGCKRITAVVGEQWVHNTRWITNTDNR